MNVAFVWEEERYAVPPNLLLALVRYVLEGGQFIGRSLLLPVPSVKGPVFSPKGSQVCYAPIVWEEEKRLIAEFTA